MENKFREYWVYSNEEYAPTYACDFNQRGFVPSRNRESIHTIEIAAVEQLKADLRTSDLNRQSLWAESLKLVDENAALKSKLKIAKETLTNLKSWGYQTQWEIIDKAMSEIGGEI